jgi:DNA invertase Pin-like site-specific DNA recombinase
MKAGVYMKLAVIYMRMSTDMQEHSLSSQERMLREYAKRNGYKIIRKYVDEGISGQHASKRPDFMQMIDDSEAKEFQYVLIYDSSRFARNLVESLTYKKLLTDNGVRLISITEPNIEDDEMQLYFDAFAGASNEIYVRKLSKNVKRGHIDKCIRGEQSGTPSFGYYKDKYHDVYQVNEEEASIVRYMYDAILNNQTYFSIARTLADKGVKSRRGNSIDSRQVLRMLKNPAYKGYMNKTIDEQTFYKKSDIEPIVSEDVFDQVQEIIMTRTAKYKKYDKPEEFRKHWLSGLLVCPYCQGGYNYNNRSGNRNPQFRCGNQTRGACHDGSSILVENVVKMVLDKLKVVYAGPLEPYLRNIKVPTPEVTIDYKKEISKLNLQLKRAKEAYLEEIDTLNEYKENKTRIGKEILRLQKEQSADHQIPSVDQEQFKAKLLNVFSLLEDDNVIMSEKIAAARSLIEKIYIDPRKKIMEIYFFA